MSNKEWGLFERFMASQYRPATVQEYRWRYKKFLETMNIKTVKDLQQLTTLNVIDYIDDLKKRLGNTSTHAYAVKALLEFHGMKNLAAQVPAPRGWAKFEPKWIPWPVLKMMIDSHSPNKRMKAISALGYDLALRISEAVALNRVPRPDTQYVDTRKGLARIYRLKTRQYPIQLLQVSEWALEHVRKYLAIRRDNDPALFTSLEFVPGAGGGRISARNVERYWGLWTQSLGYPYPCTYKVLRHSRLTWMAIEGKSIIEIAKFAGHTSTNSTLIYTHIGQQFTSNPMMFLDDLKKSEIYEPGRKALEEWIAKR